MKIFKFILSLLLTLGLIYFLSNPFAVDSKTTLPPIGSFFSPFTGFWKNAESKQLPQFSSIEIPGMKGKVTIHFDRRMVPHIFAENIEDAVFAQGYIEGGLRLWQMDLLSRVGSGRLAEVLGENLLETDKLNRRRGMLYGAKNTEKAWRESEHAPGIMGAYTAGVNAWIDQLQPKDYPIEFKLLNYKPEKWSLLKSALVRQYMNLTLNFREDDVEATNTLQLLGQETFDKVFPEINPKQKPIIPAGTMWDFEPVKTNNPNRTTEGIGYIENPIVKGSDELVGSNNWAVNGNKTLSGKPILCNDPHLQLSLPSIWFEVQIHTPEMNAYGVSIPGIPGVIIGFNEDIAWGATNVGHDVADWYKIEWADDSKKKYILDGQAKETAIIVEPYKIKGQEALVYDTVKWTVWGPVVYESSESNWKDLALRWISHDVPSPDDIMSFLGLNKGTGFDDYKTALRHHSFPAQNFIYADNSGNIAIAVNGWLPLKSKGQGPFVQDGSKSSNQWQGIIPMEHIPMVKNPPQDFVASANQRSTDSTYPYYYNSAGFDDYRGRLLHNALSQMDSIGAEEMMALQLFNYSIHAAEGLPILINNVNESMLSDNQLFILSKMKKWQYAFDPEKIEPAIFQTWWSKFYTATFDEVLVYRDSFPVLSPEFWRLIELTETDPTDSLFDIVQTPEKEDAKVIATTSFIESCEELADKLLDPSFNWATHKGTSIMHLTKIPAFSKMNLDVGGYRQALNAISEFHGPSWRMVVELGENVKGWGVFPGGQSGNPGSKYYDLDVEKWRTGDYNQLYFMKNEGDNTYPVLYTININ